MHKYVPIIRWKRGEQVGLHNLTSEIKDQIMPLIEVPFTPTAEKSIRESIDKYWNNRPFYFYLHNDWFEETENLSELYTKYDEQYNKLDNTNAVMVFDLTNINYDFVEHYGPNTRLGIRIQNNEFELVEKILNQYVSDGIVNPIKTDLILDLRYVYTDDYYSKATVLKSILLDLENISDYKSIIISSCSFPNSLINIDTHKVYNYPRKELDINLLSDSLAKKLSFNYIYSDHGPSDLEEVDFIVGMVPNFKIRYTTFDQYLYIKGLSIKKGGLDIDQVVSCAKLLANRPDFSGEGYSWGDRKIHDLANSLSNSSGNLTSWISYSYNHHITLIVNQL